MNTHDEYREKLSALLDGELSNAEREEALAHLETCEDCKTYFAELSALRGAFGDMEPVDAPEGFAAGVLARLREEDTPKVVKKRNPWRVYGTLAACAAVVVLAVTALPNALRMGAKSDSAEPEMAMSIMDADSNVNTSATADSGSGAIDAQLYMTTDTPAGGSAEAPEASVAEAAPAEPAEAEDSLPMANGASGDMAFGAAALQKRGAEALTLSGEGAEDWLRANGTFSEADGWYLVSVEALGELPDSLTLEGVVEPVDGLVPVAAAETEAAP